MRSAAVLLGLCFAGLLALAAVVLTQKDHLAFTLGVPASGPVTSLQSGQTVCQGPISIPDDAARFDRVVVYPSSGSRRGQPLDVTIVRAAGGAAIASGRIAGGYPPMQASAAELGRVTTGAPFDVCIRDAGPGGVELYGAADGSSRTSSASVAGKGIGVDVAVVFERDHSRSIASLVPAMLDRASLFRASWIGAWVYVLLGLVVILGIPALLALALRDAADG
jgi:hypothetical protein